MTGNATIQQGLFDECVLTVLLGVCEYLLAMEPVSRQWQYCVVILRGWPGWQGE